MGGFAKAVADFSKLTEKKVESVVRRSINDVFNDAQTPVAQGGRMPVVTSYLRNSLLCKIDGTPSGDSDPNSYVIALKGFKVGGVFLGEWQANYAVYVEYGTSKMQARYFARGAVAKWPDFVANRAREALNNGV